MNMLRKHILIVEDDFLVLHSMAIVLEEDFEVTTAQSCEEAWTLLQRGEFDVVVSDIMMEGMNGFELLNRIRSGFPKLPVIMLSGYVSEQRLKRVLDEGAFAYLVKPIDDRRLTKTIRDALTASRSS